MKMRNIVFGWSTTSIDHISEQRLHELGITIRAITFTDKDGKPRTLKVCDPPTIIHSGCFPRR